MWILFLISTYFSFYLSECYEGYLRDIGDPDWAQISGHHSNTPKCIDIPDNLTLCKKIGYKRMRLPNLLDHDSIQEVVQQAQSWNPLLGIRCHPDTQLFLCSLYTPVCLQQPRPIYPCRSLCEAVKAGCEQTMMWYGFSWPKMLNCSKFPADTEMCIEMQHNVTISKYTIINCILS